MPNRTLQYAAAITSVLLVLGIGLIYWLGYWGELVYGFLLWVALALAVDVILWKPFIAYVRANPTFYGLAVFLLTMIGLGLVATVVAADIGVIMLVVAGGMVVASLKK